MESKNSLRGNNPNYLTNTNQGNSSLSGGIIFSHGGTLPGRVLLAPMAGYTDAAFRAICLDHGADFCFTEMVSAEAMARGNKKTLELLHRHESEIHYGIQIFAGNAESAAIAAEIVHSYSPRVIDLNCGCPVPKITRSGAGSALMRNPQVLSKILSAMVRRSKVPLGIKIRLGWREDEKNYIEIGKMAQDLGVSFVSLHGRTKTQGYGGKADWAAIKQLKQALSIPVFGSGDLFTPEDLVRMHKETACDGVLVARGALGNPFIFRETKTLLSRGLLPAPPTPSEKIETALKHAELEAELKGEKRGVKEMKKHICAYTKGLPNSAEARNELVHAGSLDEYRQILGNYLRNLQER